LTLKKPILLPADANRRELPIQRQEVSMPADSPIKIESKLLTIGENQDSHDDLKPFSRLPSFGKACIKQDKR
jgi:hypothetical protein